MNGLLPAHHTRQCGAALIEFALVLPILLVLVIAIIYYGYVFMLDAAVTHAAKQGAHAAVNIRPTDFESPSAYTTAVGVQVNNSVSDSLSWLPPSVRDGLSEPPAVVTFSQPAAGQVGMQLSVTVSLNVAGGSSPLLPQITLPGIGRVPVLPQALNGLALVVL